MNIKRSRLFSCALAVLLLLGLCPVSAQSGEVPSAEEIQAAIDDYEQAVTQEGTQPAYWNAGHDEETVKRNADEGAYLEEISRRPCRCVWPPSGTDPRRPALCWHLCHSNHFSGSRQCHGFGLYLCYVIFGSTPAADYAAETIAGAQSGAKDGWTTYRKGDDFPGIQTGDLIRRQIGRTGWHTVVVYSVSDQGELTVIDCNRGDQAQSSGCAIQKGTWTGVTTQTIQRDYENGRCYLCRYTGDAEPVPEEDPAEVPAPSPAE